MNKKEYLSKFSRIARWRLPADMAEDVIADYTEIMAEDVRSEAEWQRDFGNPLQAVKELGTPKDYQLWMAVFAVLSLCILLPVLWLWGPMYGVLIISQGEKMSLVFMVLGVALSLFWFFRKGNAKTEHALRRILPVAAVLLLLMISMTIAFWYTVSHPMILDWPYWIGQAALRVLQVAGLFALAAGIYGLVLSRTSDRRWRAIYILGLTWAVLCALSLCFIGGINLPATDPGSGWWLSHIAPSLAVLLFGTAAAGVSLC